MGVELPDACLQVVDVGQDRLQHEPVLEGDVAVEGGGDLLARRLQPAVGMLERLLGRGPGDQRRDHGARRLAVEVAHHHAEADAGVGQHLAEPVLLGRQHADQLLALARDEAQPAQTSPAARTRA